MNALVTALPGLVPIFVLAGGVNALAGVLLLIDIVLTVSHLEFYIKNFRILDIAFQFGSGFLCSSSRTVLPSDEVKLFNIYFSYSCYTLAK